MKRRKTEGNDDVDFEAEEPVMKRLRSGANGKRPSKKAQINGTDRGVSEAGEEHEECTIAVDSTPKKRQSGTSRYGTPRKTLPFDDSKSTPKTDRQSKGTPRIVRNANRSARKKSTRTLIERTILGATSENEDDEDELAGDIYGTDEEEEAIDGEDGDEVGPDEDAAPETPSKRRGRPRGSGTRQRSPSPEAQDLPSHEQYFVQNRPGRAKTSNNTLATLKLLDHEEYFTVSRGLEDSHKSQIAELAQLHETCFPQWHFELSQQFNVCIYGWGSKRTLLMKFAQYIYDIESDHEKHKIVVINGYITSLTIRDVFNTVALAIAEPGTKLGSQPAEMLDRLISLIEEDDSQRVTLVINSIDRAPLRRQASQGLLSRLAAHPQIQLIASADHPQFPLLWDDSTRSTYNFVFHGCATFKPYTSEVDVVDEVHELLGRSGRRVGGKDGVIFVLKSLPVNATNLFKILVAEQLTGMRESAGQGEENQTQNDNFRRPDEGVEYRSLYQKAVEEFICSNDMGFRSLLKE